MLFSVLIHLLGYPGINLQRVAFLVGFMHHIKQGRINFGSILFYRFW